MIDNNHFILITQNRDVIVTTNNNLPFHLFDISNKTYIVRAQLHNNKGIIENYIFWVLSMCNYEIITI